MLKCFILILLGDFVIPQFNKNKSRTTALHTAAKEGDLEQVRQLIRKGVYINRANAGGATALFLAAKQGHLDIVIELLNKGAKIDKGLENAGIYKEGARPLYVASENGQLDIVNELIKRGADIDLSRGYSAPPLCIASQNGHLDVVNTLLLGGASIEAKTNLLKTALHLASENGHLDVVNTLLVAGANVDTISLHNKTPLKVAIEKGHSKIVEALVAFHADIYNSCIKLTPIKQAIKSDDSQIINLIAKHPDTTLKSLKDAIDFATETGVSEETQAILIKAYDSRVEIAEKDPTWNALIKHAWPASPISFNSIVGLLKDNPIAPLSSEQMNATFEKDYLAMQLIRTIVDMIDESYRTNTLEEWACWCQGKQEEIKSTFQVKNLKEMMPTEDAHSQTFFSSGSKVKPEEIKHKSKSHGCTVQ